MGCDNNEKDFILAIMIVLGVCFCVIAFFCGGEMMMKASAWAKWGTSLAIAIIMAILLFFVFKYWHGIIKAEENQYYVLTKENVNDRGTLENQRNILVYDDITCIFPRQFSGYYNLEKIEFYGKVQIHEAAFFGCTNLTEVVFHNDIVSIGENAFAGCKKLKEITLASGVTEISDGTFNNCKALEKIDLPDSVKSIGETAFKGCKSLSAITIPKSVTSIGENAFDGCKKLTTINYAGTKDDWNKSFDENTTNWKKGIPAQGVTCSDGNTYAWDTTDSNKLGDPL